jgi:hypothetical protein
MDKGIETKRFASRSRVEDRQIMTGMKHVEIMTEMKQKKNLKSISAVVMMQELPSTM